MKKERIINIDKIYKNFPDFKPDTKKLTVYWISREQRINDNHALNYAIDSAMKSGSELYVVFCLVEKYLDSIEFQFDFMIKGLKELAINLKNLNIYFKFLKGEPAIVIPQFIHDYNADLLITDFSPLKLNRKWQNDVEENINIPLLIIDSHNIVPVTTASQKQEFSAKTIRNKINSRLDEYLEDLKSPQYYPYNNSEKAAKYFKESMNIMETLNFASSSFTGFTPGEKAAHNQLQSFILKRLKNYEEKKNDPASDSVSSLSPYIHFGQISSSRIALTIMSAYPDDDSRKSFLEELIVRKELADNFCFYNENYDNFNGFPEWAKKTLNNHRKDIRDYLYTFEQFENAETHDVLWNAAQNEMLKKAKMHGYLRMYWAKKILEWTESPEQAMEFAILLNNRYELDGRDPKGYTGIAWSIGGVHDRPWFDRPVFGSIRFMSFNSQIKKIDLKAFLKKIES